MHQDTTTITSNDTTLVGERELTTRTGGTDVLDLSLTELEGLEAPGFWDTAAGVGAGAVLSYGAVVGAVAFT